MAETAQIVKLPNAELVKLIEQYKTVLNEVKEQQIAAGENTDRLDDAYQVHTMDQNMILSQEAINIVMYFGKFCFEAARETDGVASPYKDFQEFINSLEF